MNFSYQSDADKNSQKACSNLVKNAHLSTDNKNAKEYSEIINYDEGIYFFPLN